MSQLKSDREKYNSGYYKEKLQEGLEYQDFVTRELYRRGIVLVGYSSRKYQNGEGENMLGAEIKRDGRFRETGNLYIEVAEKSHPDNARFISSGVFRNDNSWLFVIGDEKTIYIFSIKILRMIEGKFRRVSKTTSIAFLLPIDQANKYCIRRIDL